MKSTKSTTDNTTRPPTGSTRPQTASKENHSIIISISEARGIASEVGICALDQTTGACSLYQYSDTQTFSKTMHKLYMLNPLYVLLPSSSLEPCLSKLACILKECFPELEMVPYPRKYYNDQSGLNFISTYGLPQEIPGLLLVLESKYFAITCIGALFTYLESDRCLIGCYQSIRFKFESIDGILMMDMTTAKNLELVSSYSAKKGPTLLSVLDQTQTKMGARLLKMNILQPLSVVDIIQSRLESVEELNIDPGKMQVLRKALKPLVDLDQLIFKVNQSLSRIGKNSAEQSINLVLSLKQSLEIILELRTLVEEFHASSLLETISQILHNANLDSVLQHINLVINEQVSFQKGAIGLRNQRCFAVKSGFNGLLDVARQTYKESTNDVHDLVVFYSEKYQLTIKTHFEASLGFSLCISCTDLGQQQLPLEFINVVKKRKSVYFTTLKLMSLNDRIQESLTEVYLMSDKAIADVILNIRQEASILYKASECLGMLDMLLCFSYLCSRNPWIRPEFTDTLAIKNGCHVVKAQIQDSFVSNDTFSNNTANMTLITGPNMSGKTTYLSQIALLTVMSHIGCFVPAEYASFRMTDCIFTRMGSDDSLQSNASTFMVEMREIAFIMQNLTNHSLVVIDELGRGTSLCDGLGMTIAICESFLQSQAFIFLATHFKELTNVLSKYPNVVNLYLKVDTVKDATGTSRIKYLYSIGDGTSDQEHYGLKLARVAGLPNELIIRAHEISLKLKD